MTRSLLRGAKPSLHGTAKGKPGFRFAIACADQLFIEKKIFREDEGENSAVLVFSLPVELEADVTLLDVLSGERGSFQAKRLDRLCWMLRFRSVNADETDPFSSCQFERVAVDNTLYKVQFR